MTTVKADIAAADRVLTAAVRKARRQIVESDLRLADAGYGIWHWRDYDREAIVELFDAVQIAVAPLLEERPA